MKEDAAYIEALIHCFIVTGVATVCGYFRPERALLMFGFVTFGIAVLALKKIVDLIASRQKGKR